MIPSKNWFPTNLQERAAWYENFNAQAQATGLTFGLVQANLDQIKDDNSVMQFLASAAVTMAAYDDAVRAFRKTITEGEIGDPTPEFPANISLSPPATVPTGLFERLDNYVGVIRKSLNYTPETGAAYGIVPSSTSKPIPDTVKPTIQVFAAQMGYLFSVVVANRGDSDMWEVLVMKKGAANWQSAGSFTGKSGDVTVTPTTAGEPEQVQVRIQLKKNNANYGQLSDVVYVTLNP